jgi:hypothetical protein
MIEKWTLVLSPACLRMANSFETAFVRSEWQALHVGKDPPA